MSLLRTSLRRRVALVGAFSAGALIASTGCRPRVAPDQPIPSTTQMCCKAGHEEKQKFAGCRTTKNRCPSSHPLWLRGAVRCGPVEPDRCLGERCCEFRPRWGDEDSQLHWDPDAAPAPGATEPSAARAAAPGTEVAAPAPAEASESTDAVDESPAP